MSGEKNEKEEPRIVRLATELNEVCVQIAPAIQRQRPGGADQLERAGASALANVGEALDSEAKGEMRRYLRYAKGSAGEVQRELGALEKAGLLPVPVAEGLRLCRDLKMDCVRLINWTRR